MRSPKSILTAGDSVMVGGGWSEEEDRGELDAAPAFKVLKNYEAVQSM